MKDYKKVLKELREQKIEVSELLIASELLDNDEDVSNVKLEEQVYYIHEKWLDNEAMSIEEAIDKYVYGIEV